MSDIASRHMENPDMPGNPPVSPRQQNGAAGAAAKAGAFLKKISNIGAGGKMFFDEIDEVKLPEIQHDLEVGDDKEKLVAMKRLLAVCFHHSPLASTPSTFFLMFFFVL